MHIFEEGKLVLEFDSHWNSVIDYDEHSASDYIRFFRNDGVTALDFVASRENETGNKQLFFIELKDVRGYEEQPETQQKLANSARELTNTVGRNLRDTIYGIVLGNRKPEADNYAQWQDFLKQLQRKDVQVIAVLWLEADLTVLPAKPTRHAITREFKRKVSKLTRQVWACDQSDNPIPGLQVYDRKNNNN